MQLCKEKIPFHDIFSFQKIIPGLSRSLGKSIYSYDFPDCMNPDIASIK